MKSLEAPLKTEYSCASWDYVLQTKSRSIEEHHTLIPTQDEGQG